MQANPQVPVTIEVSEKGTKKPIQGAAVYLERCSHYDNQFGCTSFSNILTLTTNDAGKATFLPPKGLESYQVQHKNYYTTRQKNASIGSTILTPKCTIKVSIKQVKAYSANDVLYLAIADPDCFSYLCWSRRHRIGLPKDTVVYVEGQGNTLNQVLWYINFLSTDTLHSKPPVYINGFDTAYVDVKY
jgi:hypothetical protein